MNAEIESFQGTWDVVALEIDGKTMPESGFHGSRLVVKGNTFTTISMGATYGGTLTVDAAKNPKTLDLSFTAGPEKDNKSVAIYELDGDSWKLCLTVTGRRLVKGNETTVLFGSQVFLKAAFSLDPSKTPKTIDYIVTAGESLGEAQAEIYAFQGDTLTYCIAPRGRPRPTDFAIKGGIGATRTVWKRKKK